MKNLAKKTFTSFLLLVFGLSSTAFADESVVSAVKSMQDRMDEMQKTMNWQSQQLRDLQTQRGAAMPESPADGAGGAASAEEFNTQLEKAIGKDYKWLKDLKFKGDFRLRYEGLQETGSGASADRNRMRYRLRFGFEKKMKGPFEGDKMKVGFRLASAPSGDRTSTNTTFDDQFAFKDISIDQAYASYYPGALNREAFETEITAGKFKNPFLEGSTWVIWDGDVMPEGIYEKFDIKAVDTEGLKADASLILGQLVVDESGSPDNNDAELWAYQGVVNTQIDMGAEKPLKTRHAISFYDYRDFVNGNFGSAGNNFSSGGRLSAEDFYVLDFYNEVGIDIPGFAPVKFYFDWIKNLGEDASSKTLGGGHDKAWMLGAKIGSAKKKGQWELKYEYAWIEANAVPGVFTDSDFGGTDRRGSVFKAGYALTDNLALKGALFFTNRILTGNPGIDDRERDLMQIDLVWKI